MLTSNDQRGYRLQCIDLVRGLVIIIMALDHVRDFFMVAGPAPTSEDASPALFATRWITHFCAPVFVLLAGSSAGLMVARKSKRELTCFLFTRGVWLILVESFIVSTASTFSPGGLAQLNGDVIVVMQVIWAIGTSMVILAGAHLMGRRVCFAVGIVVLLCHNLVDPYWPESKLLDESWPLWVSFHSPMSYRVGPFLILFSYPLLPWTGVMLFGFGLAGLFELPPNRRNALLFEAGIILTAIFVAIRWFDIYGDPNHWRHHEEGIVATVIDFLNTTKYPPSLSFLLMTLGPAAIVCSCTDRITGWIKEALVVFGRAPFAFYVTHLFLIHSLSIVLGVVQGFHAGQFFTIYAFFPEGYGVPLPGVYAVWVLVVALLYPLCRRIAAIKASRKDWWLSYL